MKLLGLIGGVSPESTEVYVRHLNRNAREKLGGEHSANFLVWHLDYGVMAALYHARDWDRYRAEICKAGEGLKRAGAEAMMIGSNTSHLAADALARATGLPVIHVVDALAAAMEKARVRRPLLLGTPVTMEDGSYYRTTLGERFGGEPIVPSADEQREVGRIIFDELCVGIVSDDSRHALLGIIRAHDEADAVILGCTELSLILGDCAHQTPLIPAQAGIQTARREMDSRLRGNERETDLPFFDTTALHAAAGSAFAFGG